MHVYDFGLDELDNWIRDEVVFDTTVARGDDGVHVKRVQEWLHLHGFQLSIDSDFGPATERQVNRFQSEHMGIEPTGKVDVDTFDALVAPMVSTLGRRDVSSLTVGGAMVDYAQVHLDANPREVGGANAGPWVRLYMRGHDGAAWLWCAGFTTFVMEQASQSLGVSTPIGGDFACDTVANQGKDAGLFVGEDEVDRTAIPAGSIFLVRKTSTDWTHVGLVTWAGDESFDTIEGNTNDEGSREGYEVCARSRAYADKDFILID